MPYSKNVSTNTDINLGITVQVVGDHNFFRLYNICWGETPAKFIQPLFIERVKTIIGKSPQINMNSYQ